MRPIASLSDEIVKVRMDQILMSFDRSWWTIRTKLDAYLNAADAQVTLGLRGKGQLFLSHRFLISIIGARGFALRLIPSLGVRGGGLARIQNCSAGAGGVQPKYLENCQKVQRQKPRHWGLENSLGAVQHAILLGILPRFFLVSAFFRKTHQQLTNNSPTTHQNSPKTHQNLSKLV